MGEYKYKILKLCHICKELMFNCYSCYQCDNIACPYCSSQLWKRQTLCKNCILFNLYMQDVFALDKNDINKLQDSYYRNIGLCNECGKYILLDYIHRKLINHYDNDGNKWCIGSKRFSMYDLVSFDFNTIIKHKKWER